MSKPQCPRALHAVIRASDAAWRAQRPIADREDVRACVICGAKLGKLTWTINKEVAHG